MGVNGIIQGKNTTVSHGASAGASAPRKEEKSGELFEALLQARSTAVGAESVEMNLHRKMLQDFERSSNARAGKPVERSAARPSGADASPSPRVRERDRNEPSAQDRAAAPERPAAPEKKEPVSTSASAAPLVEPATCMVMETALMEGSLLAGAATLSGGTPGQGDAAATRVTDGAFAADALAGGPATTGNARPVTPVSAVPDQPATPLPDPVAVPDTAKAAMGDPARAAVVVPQGDRATSGAASPVVDPTVQAQAADLARTLDADTRLDVRVRVTDAGSGSRTSQVAEADTQRPAAPATASDTDSGSRQPASRNGPHQSVVQQAQASNLGQTGAPAAAAQGGVSFEKLVAERQAAERPAANRADTLRAEARSADTAATVRQGAGPASSGGGVRAATGVEAQPPQGASAPSAGRAPEVPQTEQATRTAPRAHTPAQARAVIDQVRVNISKALDRGMDQIRIQLRPASLGRVEVRMELASDTGQVRATLIVDRPETLEMLRSDQRSLERALQDAGLKTDSNGLNFELRGQQQADGGERQGAGRADPLARMADDTGADDALLLQEDIDAQRLAQARQRGGVDVRV